MQCLLLACSWLHCDTATVAVLTLRYFACLYIDCTYAGVSPLTKYVQIQHKDIQLNNEIQRANTYLRSRCAIQKEFDMSDQLRF